MINKNKFKAEAFWISPKGKILPVKESSRHILDVIKAPKKFGYTTKELKNLFFNHGEEYGIEGKARELIIKDLISKGWIRIRKYTRPDRWTVNVPNFSDRTIVQLRAWASKMIKAGWGKYGDVYIDTLNDKRRYSLDEISSGIVLK